jgi:cytochrome b561/polyisoprenoid-binding protein YceI
MPAKRYTAVAILLHWAIALAIAGMIALGWWMGDALEDKATQAQAIAAFQLHKSIGLTILLLSLARLGWRFMHPVPPLPAGMKRWERWAATGTHWAFYVVIIAMPLTGWLYVSTAWNAHTDKHFDVPTLYFGLFKVPHLFGLSQLAEGARAALAELFENFHSKLAWGAIGLTVLHVGAALKHHFVDRDDVLARMVPGLAPETDAPKGRALALIGGAAAIVLAAAAALWAFQNPPTGANAPPASVLHTHEDGAGNEAGSGREDRPKAGDDAHDADDHSHETPPAAAAGASPLWNVARAASYIRFSGTHAGVGFEGRFNSWRAEIRFDPGDLAQSFANVSIDTGSAADGVALHDQTLPGADWFDVARHSTASFRTTSIRARGGGRYQAHGVLTIKGRAIETELPFTLRIDGDRALMDGTISLSRAETNLGMGDDPDAEYVSRDIVVSVHVEAQRAR